MQGDAAFSSIPSQLTLAVTCEDSQTLSKPRCFIQNNGISRHSTGWIHVVRIPPGFYLRVTGSKSPFSLDVVDTACLNPPNDVAQRYYRWGQGRFTQVNSPQCHGSDCDTLLFSGLISSFPSPLDSGSVQDDVCDTLLLSGLIVPSCHLLSSPRVVDCDTLLFSGLILSFLSATGRRL